MDISLRERVLDIAYKNNLSHLGSYFSNLDIIDEIYSQMDENDIFILSCGHAALALYVALEKYYDLDAEQLFEKHGGHPHRDEENHIYCSTGSLGLGLLVAIGRALAKKDRTVHCLISDGECAEGSIWEGLRFIQEKNIKNIRVYVNINGYAAYDAVDKEWLTQRLHAFYPDVIIVYTSVMQFPFLKGLNAHYHIMSKDDYEMAKKEVQDT
tara:strand:- start:405 stop:1037 length:633 start_codon:yes stop_codon:yes gene_type:complete